MRRMTDKVSYNTEVKHMKKAFIVALTVAFVFGLAAMAVAAPDDILGNNSSVNTASPTTFTEKTPDFAGMPTANSAAQTGWYGASTWLYKDAIDTGYKNEGSYRAFQNQEGTGTTEQGGYGAGYYNFDGDINVYDKGPHDGYDTGSNKCKTCHAVHRANGTYRLMRVDSADDACSYCHIGDTKHSIRGAYYGGNDTVYPANGHTMGAGPTLPDSSVQQWLTSRTITATGSSGETLSMTIRVREYNSTRNKMFYYSAYRASYHDAGLRRLGPTVLSCLSCHQPHNADALIWKPSNTTVNLTDGYKLLRNAPSGSTKSTNRMKAEAGMTSYFFIANPGIVAGDTTATLGPRSGTLNIYVGDVLRFAESSEVTDTAMVVAAPTGSPSYYNATTKAYSLNSVNSTTGVGGRVVWFTSAFVDSHAALHEAGLADGSMVTVPNTKLVKDTTGTNAAGDQNAGVVWTLWKGSNMDVVDNFDHDSVTYTTPRLSVWCADCHNLNIGYYESPTGGSSFRSSDAHSDRTHSAGGRIECWSCHTTNMPTTSADYTAYFAGYSGVQTNTEGLACAQCHYYHNGMEYYQDVRQEVPKSDFPHSGADTGYKLLTEVTTNQAGGVTAASKDLDKLCTRCHDEINSRM